jgi:hypothetical protein
VIAITSSTYHRCRVRTVRHEHFLNWQRGPLFGPARSSAERQRRNDRNDRPARHYSVRWEKFSDGRALYRDPGRADDPVSTLAPNAPEILKDVLRIANYPCEEWPNLDL